MTVRQLIDRLAALNPELTVIMPGENTDFCEVGAAFEDLVVFEGFDVQLSDERSSSSVERVIRLFPRED